MPAAPRAVRNSRSDITEFSARFSIKQRLLQKDGFGHVLTAESIADRNFKIYFLRNGRDGARLGIVASKRTLPKATDRNRVKRIVREVFRRHVVKFRRLDLVVMVRRSYGTGREPCHAELSTLFSRIENRCAE